MEFIYRDIEEKDKSLATVEHIWADLLSHRATRADRVVAIGGGATLDTVGFAAATYKRGVPWIATPTTLLAMVDAGTGGKTAINYPTPDGSVIKNAIGAFWPPEEVRIDTTYLRTLPYEELLSGYGEMIKHGLLDSQEHLQEVLRTLSELHDSDMVLTLGPLIERSRQVKVRIVEADPTEKGIRKALNLGHTIGHALEELSMRGEPIRHGYAVLYGLVAELYISHVLEGLDKQVVSTISRLIPEFYPRPNVSCKQYETLYELMQQDKKGPLNFTLLSAVGQPVINRTADKELIFEALDYLFSI